MKFLLCAFVLILSVFVYPVTQFQSSELYYIFGFIETDLFNWYRMLLVSLMIPLIFLGIKKIEWQIAVYLLLLAVSTLLSRFPETSLYGTPMHHEGLFAILGYFGLYQAARKYGIFPKLEQCLDATVYITGFMAGLQLYYGNFLNFPPFKAALSGVVMTVEVWPIYANLGGPNNLGLFCSLMAPYALARKKYLQFCILAALLIGSQSRFAWLSVAITTMIISRRALWAIVAVALALSIVRHDIITERTIKAMNSIHYPIQDGDLSGRAYMWKRAIPVLKDSILLGKGPGTYLHYVPQFHERGDQIGFYHRAIDRPHNMFINIWASSGLLSLIALGSLVFKKLKTSKNYPLKLAIIGYLMAGVFTDSVLCVTPYFSLLLGGLIYEHNEARGNAKREVESRVGDS